MADENCGRFINQSRYLKAYNCIGDKSDFIAVDSRSLFLSWVGQNTAAQALFDTLYLGIH
jgi:hypothetical protein